MERVKADSFKHMTGRLGLMLVTALSKAMIQHMKNSVFCRCLRSVYRSSVVSTSLVVFELGLIAMDVDVSCCICFDVEGDLIIVFCRGLFPKVVVQWLLLLLRREEEDVVLGIYIVLFFFSYSNGSIGGVCFYFLFIS